ncbi:MAG TPA: hypothetical protein PKV70_08255 [Thermodesulfobacteriota bacterium]|nr:hypothetical protein [Thermodesulfobacteriota bacterium]HQU14229.1 hypothetical protein [Thermodesulfobacteriota bacterium]
MANKNTVGAILAIAYTLIFAAVLGFLLYGNVPKNNEKYVLLLLGSLVGFAGTAVNFFLGSSLGSTKKDDAITNLTAPAAPGGPGAPPLPGP